MLPLINLGNDEQPAVRQLLTCGVTAARMIGEPHFSALHLAKIAGRFLQLGARENATELLNESLSQLTSIEREFLHAAVLDQVARALLTGAEIQRSNETTSQLLTCARRIEQPPLKAHYLAEVADLLFTLQRYDEALAIPTELLSFAEQDNALPFSFMYSLNAAISWVRQGLGPRAHKLVYSLTPPALQLEGLLALARTYADLANTRMTRHYAKLAAESFPDNISALCQLANSLVRLGDLAEARDIVMRTLQTVEDSPWDSNQRANTADLAYLLARLGLPQVPVRLLTKAMQGVQSVSDPDLHTRILKSCADAYGVLSLMNSSLEAIAQISDLTARQEVLKGLAWSRTFAARLDDFSIVLHYETSPQMKAHLAAIAAASFQTADTHLTLTRVQAIQHELNH